MALARCWFWTLAFGTSLGVAVVIGRGGGFWTHEVVSVGPDIVSRVVPAYLLGTRLQISQTGEGEPLRVTASIGTATLPDAAGTVRELFEAADEALYEAKRQGKNRVVTAPSVERARQ